MGNTKHKPRVLFLCTGNSCRSQMAEGIARHFYEMDFDIESAGIERHGMNPYAMKVMSEAGMDISAQSSKTLDEVGIEFDTVITVCDHAHENCPVFSRKTTICHHPFADPPKLALEAQTEEQKLECYRQVRNEIHHAMGSILKKIC
ncbi:MAG: arsenate reductase ArsC [Lentisphaeraceae bacterium]|nr:arsenate reductase ArsC [Lentisphaeraceae bacterium]